MSEIAARIKGKLARQRPDVCINISQIRSITEFNYIGDLTNEGYTVIEIISDNTQKSYLIYTREPYPLLTARIQRIRINDGPNALIEIATVKAYG